MAECITSTTTFALSSPHLICVASSFDDNKLGSVFSSLFSLHYPTCFTGIVFRDDHSLFWWSCSERRNESIIISEKYYLNHSRSYSERWTEQQGKVFFRGKRRKRRNKKITKKISSCLMWVTPNVMHCK